MSLQSSMIGLMGEMLQQMKEQNRQQAEYNRSTLAQQKEQNDRMYEVCKMALSQQREAPAAAALPSALAPTTPPAQVAAAQRLLQRAPVKVKCEDDSLAYKPVLLETTPGPVGTTLLQLFYGLDDMLALHKNTIRSTYLPQYLEEQLSNLQVNVQQGNRALAEQQSLSDEKMDHAQSAGATCLSRQARHFEQLPRHESGDVGLAVVPCVRAWRSWSGTTARPTSPDSSSRLGVVHLFILNRDEEPVLIKVGKWGGRCCSARALFPCPLC